MSRVCFTVVDILFLVIMYACSIIRSDPVCLCEPICIPRPILGFSAFFEANSKSKHILVNNTLCLTGRSLSEHPKGPLGFSWVLHLPHSASPLSAALSLYVLHVSSKLGWLQKCSLLYFLFLCFRKQILNIVLEREKNI